MYWRRFPVSSIPLDDSHAFEHWLRARWTEKDRLIEGYLRTGRFPADKGVSRSRDGKLHRGAGYIETEIKPTYWYEFLQVFAPMGLFALVLYVFYGALPRRIIKTFDKRLMVDEAVKNQIKLPEKPQLLDAVLKALGDEKFGLKSAKTAQKLAANRETIQKALQSGLLRPKIGIEGTQPLVIKDKTPQRAPIEGSDTSKLSTNGTTKAKTKTNTVKPHQPNTVSTQSKTKKQAELKNTANLATKKVLPKKPEAIHATNPAIKKPETKQATTPAPRKLDVKNETKPTVKRETGVPKKIDKVNGSSSNQGAPKKLGVPPKIGSASNQPQPKSKPR